MDLCYNLNTTARRWIIERLILGLRLSLHALHATNYYAVAMYAMSTKTSVHVGYLLSGEPWHLLNIAPRRGCFRRAVTKVILLLRALVLWSITTFVVCCVFYSHSWDNSSWSPDIVPLDMKGCIWHFTKWYLHPFIIISMVANGKNTREVAILAHLKTMAEENQERDE